MDQMLDGRQIGHMVWQHKKGGRYRVLTVAINEADLKPVVVYQSTDPNNTPIWVRPVEEFLDGRFKALGPIGGIEEDGSEGSS